MFMFNWGEAGSAVFWDVIQLIVVIPYRRFGTKYRSRNVGT
jgi:hypothetical protein